MKYNSRISIIIPIFNALSYLSEALDSVINQTYRNIEIILIDDGSVDGSSQMCDEYKKMDKRIRVIHQNNKGLSAARNAGLELVTGDYIAFMDSDDKFHKEYCYRLLEAIVHNDADMAICKAVIVDNSPVGEMKWNNGGAPYPSILQGVYSREESLRNFAEGLINYSVWNKIYRSSLWKDIRFPVGHVYEDVDITFRMINRSKKICVIDEVLYLRRKHSGSITDTCSQKSIQDFLLAFTHYESFVISNISNIFEVYHLTSVRRYKLVWIIIFYIRLSRNRRREDYHFLRKLRKYTIKLRNEVGLGNSGALITVGYWLIYFCPSLIKIFSIIHCRLFQKLKALWLCHETKRAL